MALTKVGKEGITGISNSSDATAITIDSSEKVGINRSSPATTLDIDGTLTITGTASRGLKITSAASSSGQNDADAVYDAQDTEGGGTGSHIFQIGGNEKTRISGGGNLLIGATSRSNVERVNISYPRTTHCGMVIDCTDSTAATAAIKFFNPNGDVGSIDMSGSSTSYNTSSDYRLKENVADMTGAIARVKQLAPKRFNFIADADTTVDGFLAHEAQAVVPEAITGTHNEVETWTQQQIDDGDAPDGTSAGDNKLDDDGNTIPVMQGIDQSKLVPLLTGALKEAITKIETLETEMTALKARVTALEDA